MAVPVSGNTSPVARRLEGCLRHVVKGWGTREGIAAPRAERADEGECVCSLLLATPEA